MSVFPRCVVLISIVLSGALGCSSSDAESGGSGGNGGLGGVGGSGGAEDPFYIPPDPLPSEVPGTLIRSGEIQPFSEGTKAWRVLYVSTDYERLGTPGLHPYLVGPSEGRGVLDIVKAAQQIEETGAGSRVVIWGRSQGGHGALFPGEPAATTCAE